MSTDTELVVKYNISPGQKFLNATATIGELSTPSSRSITIEQPASSPKAPAKPPKDVTCILCTPYSPYGDIPTSANPTNELVIRLNAGSVDQVISGLHKIHNLPESGISLFSDRSHQHELVNNPDKPFDLPDVIYWAFKGDSPGSWYYKKGIVVSGISSLTKQVTEHMQTSAFLVEKEFAFNSGLEANQRKELWVQMNEAPKSDPLELPLEVNERGKYVTHPDELRLAYESQNEGWKKTIEQIKERIRNIRTDKKQYEENLERLRDNEQNLKNLIQSNFSQLSPPLPDSVLYSGVFASSSEVVQIDASDNYTWKSLVSAVSANNVYYQQELGKYNMLKKEECHLVSVYHQLLTRMKLWILRERLRFVAWEMQSLDYQDLRALDEIELKEKHVKVIAGDIEKNPPKRLWQCIDFCQCELGCTTSKIEKKIEKVLK